MTELTHYINGAHLQGTSGRTQPVFNPAIGASERSVPLASNSEVDTAIAAAKAAWPAWSKTPVLRRARILDKFKSILWDRADELAAILASEHGKTHDDAVGEVTRGLEVVEFAVGAPNFMKCEFSENVGSVVDRHNIRQALGVCAGITLFNFPAMVPMWMFPVALVTGNTFVLKPSERMPSASLKLAEAVRGWLARRRLQRRQRGQGSG